jgi:predicted adenine nucleotide alpha hydrolase (AANH) superfamily ATPase
LKLLLHICCAPCSTAVLERLRIDGYEITGFFYNPNIQPAEEYNKRLDDARRYFEQAGLDLIEGKYDYSDWNDLTQEFKSEPEGGKRCKLCYEMRMKHTAEVALEHGFDYFTTTLSISPYKNAKVLNDIGRYTAEELHVNYLEANFKKQNGYGKSIQKSKAMGLYRQDYCGCIYSKDERKIRADFKLTTKSK